MTNSRGFDWEKISFSLMGPLKNEPRFLCEVFDRTTIVYRTFIPRCAPDNNQCLVLEFEKFEGKKSSI